MNGSNGWDRTGQVVTGWYIGSYLCKGVVQSSRVKYGGKVQHSVQLDHDLFVVNSTYKKGSVVGIDEDQLRV